MQKLQLLLRRSASIILIAFTLSGCYNGNVEDGTTLALTESIETTQYTTESAEQTTKQGTEETTEEAAEKTTEAAAENTTEETTQSDGETDDRVRFFGYSMSPQIADINENTLSKKESGLVDIANTTTILVNDVIAMIESYSMPETVLYDGNAFTEEIKEELKSYRNIEALSKRSEALETATVTIKYGILTKNTDVRSFPTDKPAVNSSSEYEFDMFQQTGFNLGSGVLILNQTADGMWSFVQGNCYYGWVETSSIAVCTRKEMVSYLSPENFIVVLSAEAEINNIPLRLGTILPYSIKSEGDTTSYVIQMPGSSEGRLSVYDYLITDNVRVSDGFLEYNDNTVIELAASLVGQAYGWGDTDGQMDCSSMIGSVYRCFGIFLPRDTGIMPNFGGQAVSIEGLSDDEKLALIGEHPGGIILMPGHAMIYSGIYEDGMHVIHDNSSYYDSAGVQHLEYQVIDTPVNDLFGADGVSFIQKFSCFMWVE